MRRKITPAEEAAYRELAEAARKLRQAQQEAKRPKARPKRRRECEARR